MQGREVSVQIDHYVDLAKTTEKTRQKTEEGDNRKYWQKGLIVSKLN